MAFSPFSGTEGRIRLGGSITRAGVTTAYPFNGAVNVAVAGVTGWRFPQTIEKIPFTNFESPVDGTGRVWEEYLRGVASGSVQIEGFFDGDTSVGSVLEFPIGTIIVADLLFYKNPPVGYFELPILVTAFNPGTSFRGNTPASFTVEGVLQGAPAPAAYQQMPLIAGTSALPAQMNSQFPPPITPPG